VTFVNKIKTETFWGNEIWHFKRSFPLRVFEQRDVETPEAQTILVADVAVLPAADALTVGREFDLDDWEFHFSKSYRGGLSNSSVIFGVPHSSPQLVQWEIGPRFTMPL
jgi:hypothetical protein